MTLSHWCYRPPHPAMPPPGAPPPPIVRSSFGSYKSWVCTDNRHIRDSVDDRHLNGNGQLLYLSNYLYLFFAAGAGKSRSEFSGAFNSSFSRREETINCVSAAITFSSRSATPFEFSLTSTIDDVRKTMDFMNTLHPGGMCCGKETRHNELFLQVLEL